MIWLELLHGSPKSVKTPCPPVRIAAAVLAALLLVPAPGFGQEEPGPTAGGAPRVVASVPDSLLEARLRTIFGEIDEFSSVTSSVTEGVVRLGGRVDQPDARRRVEELTSSLEGVVYVVNDVEAATDVETRITPAITKIREYWDGFVSQLPVIVVALVVVLLFWAAGVFLARWRWPARWTGVNPLLWGFAGRMIRAVLAGIGFLLAFDILGITSLMGAVLGAAGIVGLALGFAFQDIVENYLAGMLMSLRRPFSVNDLVRVGEFEGRIVRLTSREVVLLSLDGNHVRLPNAHVFKHPLTNYTINPRRLFTFDVGVGVDEDLQHAASVGVETLERMKGVMEDPPPFVHVVALGESTVTIRYHGWVDQREADFFKVRSEAVRLVKAALDRASIDMPEPTYRVLIGSAPIPRDGARVPDVEAEAGRIDVTPDRKLDEQVFEDLERSDDENLLE